VADGSPARIGWLKIQGQGDTPGQLQALLRLDEALKGHIPPLPIEPVKVTFAGN
jgi:hypothetical protein